MLPAPQLPTVGPQRAPLLSPEGVNVPPVQVPLPPLPTSRLPLPPIVPSEVDLPPVSVPLPRVPLPEVKVDGCVLDLACVDVGVG